MGLKHAARPGSGERQAQGTQTRGVGDGLDHPPRGMEPDPDPNSYASSRARREATLANMAQMDYDLKMGVLVNAVEIREQISKLHTEAKTRLLGVASKCKARLPQLSAIDVSIIEDLIREALGEIANAGS